MTIRSALDGDRDAVLALAVTEEQTWFGQAEISTEEVGEWIEEEGGLASGVVAVDDEDNVCGFAAPGRYQAVFLADPAQESLLADELLPWLRERTDVVRLETFAGDLARVAAFERHGLRHLRSSFVMGRASSIGPVPAPVFPTGIEIAPYTLGDDDLAVHRLIYVDAEWASVPGHAHRDLKAWRDTARGCKSAFLARRDGRPVGWVAGRVLAGDRGCVDTIAVAISERHRGLGRALLLTMFADLRQVGCPELTLSVQAENGTALGLYRSVGLQVEQEWRTYAT